MGRFKVRMTESGVHLFNRESGLNVLLDEFRPRTLSRAPANISIALTGRCNLRCGHCFVARVDCDLRYERLLEWLRELDDNGCLGVGFGGGEPLLYPQVFDLCAFVHKETGMACTMTTNGVLLNDAAISRLSSTLDFCRISMDGIGKTHEGVRKYSFDKLRSAVQCAAKQMKIGINYLVNDVTIGDLKRIMELAAESDDKIKNCVTLIKGLFVKKGTMGAVSEYPRQIEELDAAHKSYAYVGESPWSKQLRYCEDDPRRSLKAPKPDRRQFLVTTIP